MELSEVVNPHFAVPVVGVVVCAVLVFAFGFKSPVQPPSFDFVDDDSRRHKRTKQKKKLTNGVVVSDESPPHIKQSPTQKQSINNKHTVAVIKGETPKAKQTKKAVVIKEQKVPAQEKIKHKDDDEAGEWETALPRKKKLLRKKDHEDPEKRDDGSSSSAPASPGKGETKALSQKTVDSQLPLTAVAPLDQRVKKSRGKDTGTDNQTAPVDVSDKENSPEPEKEQIVESKSPKKMKKKNTKRTSESESLVSRDTCSDKPTSVAPDKLTGKPEAGPPSDTPQKEAPIAGSANEPLPESGETKQAKSPKKKKKSKDKENASSAPAETSPVLTADSSKSQSQKPTPVLPVITQAQSLSEDSKAKSVSVDSKPKIHNVTAEPVPSDGASSAAQPAISFDELGEWQEAKQVKRKTKKARREN